MPCDASRGPEPTLRVFLSMCNSACSGGSNLLFCDKERARPSGRLSQVFPCPIKAPSVMMKIPTVIYFFFHIYATNWMTPPASVIFFSASLLTHLALTTIGTSGSLPLPSSLE